MVWVIGLTRVPLPAAKIMAFINNFLKLNRSMLQKVKFVIPVGLSPAIALAQGQEL